ncbi:hypothetical protein SAMN03080617_04127, partial [Algoriphagus alkaliphilus]
MFIRENKNRSGTVSIQVVEKNKGRNKVIFTAGSGVTPVELELLKIKAQKFIEDQSGLLPLFLDQEDLIVQTFV